MARWMDPTPEQEKGLKDWLKSLPTKKAREAGRAVDWFTLYRLKSSGHRVTIRSVTDEGTLTVNVLAQFNFVLHERYVFGIDVADLEECDLPSEGELTGAVLTQEQASDNIDAIRVMVRPDLWVMGADGKAVRKQ